MQREQAIAAKIFELLTPDGVASIEQYFHDDIVMEMPFAPKHFPEKVTGKTDVFKSLMFVPKYFQIFSMQAHSHYCCAEKNAIISEVTSIGRVRSSSKVYQNRYVFVMTFDNRKVISWREFYNPDSVSAFSASIA